MIWLRCRKGYCEPGDAGHKETTLPVHLMTRRGGNAIGYLKVCKKLDC